MEKKSMLHRMFACLLLISTAITLVSASAFAAQPVATDATRIVSTGAVDLQESTVLAASYQQDTLLVAQNTAETPAAPAVEKCESCCGGFWEVHFGGYRWMWWALAGAGLIAIHAN